MKLFRKLAVSIHARAEAMASQLENKEAISTSYIREYERCLEVLERRLDGRDYLVGDYSIVDMISWPWVLIAKAMDVPLDAYPNVTRWRQAIKERPAVQRAVDLGKEHRRSAPPTDEERRILFNQTAG